MEFEPEQETGQSKAHDLSSPLVAPVESLHPRLAMWGGLECTIARVGETFVDQLQKVGHHARIDDLDRIAALGIRTLRYPLLWEHLAPRSISDIDFRWSDARLERLERLGIDPIVGLLHHGSGPRYTNLLDGEFPQKLALYAHAIARRYPSVAAYTPVNEPLTTARFSGLYGHWYPHARDGRSFARALLNQCRATVLAMKAIRDVNSAAVLIQTEDLGKTYSTPPLLYQADFENERRWLTFDLLSGRVDRTHPMWSYFAYVGVEESELGFFLDSPLEPDVIGVNHYVTSERYLDHETHAYPASFRGGNDRDDYADVEAVRAMNEPRGGFRGVLLEAWERYRSPIAVTEAHIGSTTDEQMRWMWEAWRAADEARRAGADITAVTAWALFGLYDWDTLLTSGRDRYEPGAFDVVGGAPVATPLASMIRDLATSGTSTNPVLARDGWWRRPERILYNPLLFAEAG